MDRFCDAMISIRAEIQAVLDGSSDRENNVLKNAPHTAINLSDETWDREYSREQAAFPSHAMTVSKFWPSVARVDNVWGDRNLVCSCPPLEEYLDDEP